MKYDDFDLIQQTLEGDQQAFAALVEKYQKQIHALAWQQIGDFHIAQEITQDAFFTAFQKLSTLTDHNRFAGWLYVITNRKCIAWHRKKAPQPQSLEATDPVELEEVYYSEYMTQQREEAANKKRRAIVQKLLSKLQESERTVVNMYYIAEMTCEDIGKFLGVSPNTVRSRLHRARNKMKKDETMIKENLSSFQLPTQLTESIMKEISRLNPVAPSGNKPLVPLAVSAASAILVVLLMGVGAKHLYRFQKPYNLTAQSEPMIELIETQLVIDTPAKPALRTQIGRSDVSDKSEGTGQKSDNSLFAAAQVDEDETSTQKRQWVQAKGPEGGAVTNLYATTRGDMFAGTLSGLYRLTDDGGSWELINTRNALSLSAQSSGKGWGPMVERDDILYLATDTEVLASTDRGETWKPLGTHPGGLPIGFVITGVDQGKQANTVMYLALSKQSEWSKRNETVIFRSEDTGVSWTSLNNKELSGSDIRAITTIENTVFIGTEKGLFRLNAGKWEQLTPGQADSLKGEELAISALAVAEHQLYVVIAGPKKPWVTYRTATGHSRTLRGWTLYRSTDNGNSWNFIASKDEIMDRTHSKGYSSLPTTGPRKRQFPFTLMGPNSNIKIAATEEKILVIEGEDHSYSTDGGKSWSAFYLDDSSYSGGNASAVVMLNTRTFYRCGAYGIFRTTDGGKSWHKFNSGLNGITILTLASVNGYLYATTPIGFLASTDGGKSWTSILGVSSNDGSDKITRMVKSNGSLYVRVDGSTSDKDMDRMKPFFIRISVEDNEIGGIPGLPDSNLLEGSLPGSFSFDVSGTNLYMEYKNKLFRWKHGTTEWHDTGLKDIVEVTPEELNFDVLNPRGFKLAASGKTVYVGKRDGHIMQSFNEGDTWNDITANLPFSVKHFYEIDFAGSTVYVATDKGILYSINGTDWHATTDTEDTPIVIKRFTVYGTTVYGVVGQQVYELKQNSDTWKQMTPEIPSPISSLTVDNNTLYVGTLGRGVLRFSLDN